MTSAQAGASRIASPPFSFPSRIAGRPSNVLRHATQSLTATLPLSSRLLSGGVRDATIGIWPSPQPCIGSLNKIAGGVTSYWRCQCHPEPPAQPYVSLLFEWLDAPDQHPHRPCPGSSCRCEKKTAMPRHTASHSRTNSHPTHHPMASIRMSAHGEKIRGRTTDAAKAFGYIVKHFGGAAQVRGGPALYERPGHPHRAARLAQPLMSAFENADCAAPFLIHSRSKVEWQDAVCRRQHALF